LATLGTCSREDCEEPASRILSVPINQMGRPHHTLEIPFCEEHLRELRPDDP